MSKHLKESLKSKETREFMKVEERNVHCNKYDGCCTKQ
jgi:hypothetical protein